jgi:hypothetical protein
MKVITGKKSEIMKLAMAYYEAEDDLPNIPEEDRIQLRQVVNVMFGKLSYRTHFDFVKKDPYDYKSVKPLLKDYNEFIIKVNVSGNTSKMWGPVYNLMFRAVHDLVHARWELNFNYKDEVEAFEKQLWLTQDITPFFDLHEGLNIGLWDLYYSILRSEIIYQAAYKTYYNEFHVPVQKIVLKNLLV